MGNSTCGYQNIDVFAILLLECEKTVLPLKKSPNLYFLRLLTRASLIYPRGRRDGSPKTDSPAATTQAIRGRK